MRLARRFFRRHIIAVALAAMCSLALAGTAAAQVAPDPITTHGGIGSAQVRPNPDQQVPVSSATLVRSNPDQQAPADISAPAPSVSSTATDDSGISTLAFVLGLGGLGLLAAGAAAGVSARHHRQHGTA